MVEHSSMCGLLDHDRDAGHFWPVEKTLRSDYRNHGNIMDNRQILNHIEEHRNARSQWMTILNTSPDSIAAAQHILAINTRIELLKTLWNWSDESVDFPHWLG